MASYQELSSFLAEVERRAFKQAVFAVRDRDVAFDVVQEAMLKLTERYGASRPVEELPLVFQRILQNTIRDHYRRQKVRSVWTTLLSGLFPGGEDGDERDPLESMEVTGVGTPGGPEENLEQAQIMAIIESAVQDLPARQREAFLLRYWEDLDVRETAEVMGCSEGSVKTHCSRAVHALAEKIEARGIKP